MVQLFVISCGVSGKCHPRAIKGTQQMCGGNNQSLQSKHSIKPAYITHENILYFKCRHV